MFNDLFWHIYGHFRGRDTWNNEVKLRMKNSPDKPQSLDMLVAAKPVTTKLSCFVSHLFFRMIRYTVFNQIHYWGLLSSLILKLRTKHQVFVIGISHDFNCNNEYINETRNFNNFLTLDKPEVNAQLTKGNYVISVQNWEFL